MRPRPTFRRLCFAALVAASMAGCGGPGENTGRPGAPAPPHPDLARAIYYKNLGIVDLENAGASTASPAAIADSHKVSQYAPGDPLGYINEALASSRDRAAPAPQQEQNVQKALSLAPRSAAVRRGAFPARGYPFHKIGAHPVTLLARLEAGDTAGAQGSPLMADSIKKTEPAARAAMTELSPGVPGLLLTRLRDEPDSAGSIDPRIEARFKDITEQAGLESHGCSRMRQVAAFGPTVPVYGERLANRAWPPIPGCCTRYGEVCSLLRRSDDRWATINSGDECTIQFKPGPPAPPGMVRDYLVKLDRWDKDDDYHTAYSGSVEPYPFHAMKVIRTRRRSTIRRTPLTRNSFAPLSPVTSAGSRSWRTWRSGVEANNWGRTEALVRAT